MNGNINRLFYFCKRKEVKKLGIRIWEVGFRISDLGKSKVRKLLMLAACSLPLTANCLLLTAYRLPLTTNSLFYD